MTKQIIYAAPNFAELRRKNGYFVDKTEYIAKLERVSNPIFLRPRRFGKSFMCSMLHHYYDLLHKDEFEELFGDTWIGQNPTGEQNKYIVLHLNFSEIDSGPTLADIEASFKAHCNETIELLRDQYAPLLDRLPSLDLDAPASLNLSRFIRYTAALKWPQLYVIIDEYDNFANQIIINNNIQLYESLTGETSFLKTFFKVLKAGREKGAINNIYITGILPVTIDDLASAFNVGTYLTLDPGFESMVGFTHDEVDQLLDEIFENHDLTAHDRTEIGELVQTNYDGYHFVRLPAHEKNIPLYNTTVLMYFLRHLIEYQEVTIHLTDSNLKTSIGWFRLLYAANPELATELVDQLMLDKLMPYSNMLLANQFNVTQFFEKRYFPTSLFYLGLLTRRDSAYLTFPNLNMYSIFAEYFNEFYEVDTVNPYAEIIQKFLHQPDLAALFACYWQEYILQLPEAVFNKMNENFYRTTFYQICTQHFSDCFTWNLERSYPKGKSDLEFMGKHHTKFAGMRWVIEFKYYSKRKMLQDAIDLATFELKDDDTTQIRGYVEGLKREYPEAEISQFVIYCFANEDFRFYQVD